MRPILPYSNHFLRIPFQKGGSGLNMVVQSLTPGQLTVTNTVAVLDKLELIQEGADTVLLLAMDLVVFAGCPQWVI